MRALIVRFKIWYWWSRKIDYSFFKRIEVLFGWRNSPSFDMYYKIMSYSWRGKKRLIDETAESGEEPT